MPPVLARMTLRTRLLCAGAFGGLAVIGAASAAQPMLLTSSMWPWKAVAVFAAIIAIAFAFVGEHPFEQLGPANRVTIVRAILMALTAALIGEAHTSRIAAAAAAMALAGMLLDGVDGWLARRTGMASAFGAHLDVETDALLIMALSILVWRHEKAGAWVLACGLMRYAFVASGWGLPWMAGRLTPTRRARVVAVMQIVGLTSALLPMVAHPISAIVAAATLAALTWSFAIDVGRLRRQGQEGP
jgi:phosphatidylglycerophosphate synthase